MTNCCLSKAYLTSKVRIDIKSGLPKHRPLPYIQLQMSSQKQSRQKLNSLKRSFNSSISPKSFVPKAIKHRVLRSSSRARLSRSSSVKYLDGIFKRHLKSSILNQTVSDNQSEKPLARRAKKHKLQLSANKVSKTVYNSNTESEDEIIQKPSLRNTQAALKVNSTVRESLAKFLRENPEVLLSEGRPINLKSSDSP